MKETQLDKEKQVRLPLLFPLAPLHSFHMPNTEKPILTFLPQEVLAAIKKKEEELRDAPTDAFKFGKPPTASSAGDVSDGGSVASHRSRSSASSWDDGKSAEASVASTTKRGAAFSPKYTTRNQFSDTCCRSLG